MNIPNLDRALPANPFMEAGRLPLMRTGHAPVFDRIEMDVFKKPIEFFLVTNCVFPESPLPNVTFAVLNSRSGQFQTWFGIRIKRFSKAYLQFSDPPGITEVAGGKRPNEMHVVRENNSGINVKRHFLSDAGNHRTQEIDIGSILKQRSPLVGDDREEVRPPLPQNNVDSLPCGNHTVGWALPTSPSNGKGKRKIRKHGGQCPPYVNW